MKFHRSPWHPLAFLLLLLPFEGHSQSLYDQLIRENEVLELTLMTDMERFLANRNTEIWQPARFTYLDREGKKQEWTIEMRPRGKYRRRVCDLPPIKLKFPKKKMKGMGLGEHNDFKIVTHCLNDDAEDQLVVKEHLIYQMYREIGAPAFRAQLIKIYYIDAASLDKYAVRYGILLEDEDEMAERYGGKECKDCYGLDVLAFEEENRLTLQLFQYMIGNEDWSLGLSRNIEIIDRGEAHKKLAVPYDFDFAQMVGAPYAKRKPPVLPEENAALQKVADHFLEKKKALTDLVKNEELLDANSRKALLKQLKDFFRSLDKTIEPLVEGR